jgi:PAS domain S-box-containing protein
MSQEKDKKAGKQGPKCQPAPSKKAAIDESKGDRINELSSLHMLSRRISADLSEDRIVSTALKEITARVDPDLCFLYIRQDDQLVLKHRCQKTGNAGTLLPEVKRLGECLCGRASSTNKPVYSKNIHTDPLCTHNECKDVGVYSIAVLPLTGREGMVGVLSLASFTERDFSKQDAFLEILAGQVATALDNALVNEQLQQQSLILRQHVDEYLRAKALLQRANRALKALSKCNEALVRASSEMELLGSICRILVGEGGYKLAWIGYAEEEQAKSINVIAQCGYEEGYLETLNITWADTERGRGPTGTALRNGKPSVVKDIRNDPGFSVWRAEAVKRGYASSIALPLIGDEKTFGALNMYASEPDAFDKEEIELLEQLAGDLSYGIMALRMREKHREAEEALRESEQHLRVIFDTAQEGIIQISSTGQIVFANRRMAEMFGCTLDEVIGSSFNDHVHPDQKADSRASMGRLLSGEVDVVSVERHLVRKDSNDFWGHISARRLEGPDGKVTALVGIVTDITEVKNATEALKRSEEKYRSLFEESKDVIYISSPEGKFIDINPAGVALFGYSSKEEFLAVDITRQLYVDPSERTKFMQSIEKQGFVTDYEVRMKRKNGEELSVMTIFGSTVRNEQGNIVAYRGIMRDMTEHRKLEQQLRESQKMEAIGQLAGGIAHDFNNILSAIVGYGGMMQMKMSPDDANRLNVEQILVAADRAANLTHSLLAFSRKQIINPKPINLNDIISKAEKLLSRLIREDVELRTQTANRDLTVWADSLQIEQVLMNLATNARDAMPTGGQLILKTEEIDLNDELMMQGGILRPGRYALLTVTDTGSGMDEETLEKIFEPFFTTKEVGKGTGLGLAMVYGIIKQHNGYILASSQPGKGTTFSIYLPLTEPAAREPESMQTGSPAPRGTETILMAEDNDAVRKMTSTMLNGHGYVVIEAADGEEALRQFREHQDSIHLIILDVVLPKKNGKEVYEEVKRTRPGIKVLFTSGYTADVIHSKGIVDEGLHFISKPASIRELLQKVRDVLDA